MNNTSYRCEIWTRTACDETAEFTRLEFEDFDIDKDGEVYSTGAGVPLIAYVHIDGQIVTLHFHDKIRFHDEDEIQLRPVADP